MEIIKNTNKQELPTVAIIMSTYNGELYINEQLESILNQQDVKIKLFIRDDGSKDKTLSIINSFKNKNDIYLEKGENIGAGKSFMLLLNQVVSSNEEFDFYALSDQDDIWMNDKLKTAISFFKDDSPTLYCSNVTNYVSNKPQGLSHEEGYGPLSLKKHFFSWYIPGCTYVFNKKMAKMIKNTNMPCDELLRYRFHDTWIYTLACIYGNIVYDNDSHIFYRIHDNNTSMKKIGYINKFLLSFSKSKHRKGLRSLQARELLKNCTDIKKEDIETLKEIGEYKNDLKSRIKLITDQDIMKINGENSIIFALKVFLGFF